MNDKWALGIAAAIVAASILAGSATVIRHEAKLAVLDFVITQTIPKMAQDLEDLKMQRRR